MKTGRGKPGHFMQNWERIMKLKVQARNLQSGDRIGSGEIVRSIQTGLRTPRGKVEVMLHSDRKDRMALWGAYTEINVERSWEQAQTVYEAES